jgi:uncharacterized protein
MRIWIDFINTPQVTFFVPFIKDFIKNGHEVLLTCRDSGNTVALLKQNELSFHIIGSNAGKGILQKLMFFPRRLFRLWLFVRKQKPDIAASQSSFYQPIVARLLGIPSLYTNDNEHARGNLFGFLFANKVVLPVALQHNKFTERWPLKSKLSFYPSVKEAIYLSQNPLLLEKATGIKNKIYFRPEPWSAQYYNGPLNFFDDALLKLSGEFEVIILPRDKNQTQHYSQEKFKALRVAQKPLTLQNIVSDCVLFIGAGGSMTREMAVMEIPVISIYQAELLAVDKYLVNKDVMQINPDITYDDIRIYLNSIRNSTKEWLVLKEGEKSYSILLNLIYNLKHE